MPLSASSVVVGLVEGVQWVVRRLSRDSEPLAQVATEVRSRISDNKVPESSGAQASSSGLNPAQDELDTVADQAAAENKDEVCSRISNKVSETPSTQASASAVNPTQGQLETAAVQVAADNNKDGPSASPHDNNAVVTAEQQEDDNGDINVAAAHAHDNNASGTGVGPSNLAQEGQVETPNNQVTFSSADINGSTQVAGQVAQVPAQLPMIGPPPRWAVPSAFWPVVAQYEGYFMNGNTDEAFQIADDNFGLMARQYWGSSAPTGCVVRRRLGSGALSKNTAVYPDAPHTFKKEVEAMKALKDIEGVPTLFHDRHDEEYCILGLEYFAFGNLAKCIMMCGTSWKLWDTLCVIHQVASTMADVHALGWVHHDLKPDNILVREDYTVAVGDWGFASKLSDCKAGHGYCGTPGYMPMEVVNEESHGAKVDIPAIGAILKVCLDNRDLYGVFKTTGAVQQAISVGVDMSTWCNNNVVWTSPLGPELKALVASTWHPDPDQRPTARAVADTVEVIMRKLDELPNTPENNPPRLASVRTAAAAEAEIPTIPSIPSAVSSDFEPVSATAKTSATVPAPPVFASPSVPLVQSGAPLYHGLAPPVLSQGTSANPSPGPRTPTALSPSPQVHTATLTGTSDEIDAVNPALTAASFKSETSAPQSTGTDFVVVEDELVADGAEPSLDPAAIPLPQSAATSTVATIEDVPADVSTPPPTGDDFSHGVDVSADPAAIALPLSTRASSVVQDELVQVDSSTPLPTGGDSNGVEDLFDPAAIPLPVSAGTSFVAQDEFVAADNTTPPPTGGESFHGVDHTSATATTSAPPSPGDGSVIEDEPVTNGVEATADNNSAPLLQTGGSVQITQDQQPVNGAQPDGSVPSSTGDTVGATAATGQASSAAQDSADATTTTPGGQTDEAGSSTQSNQGSTEKTPTTTPVVVPIVTPAQVTNAQATAVVPVQDDIYDDYRLWMHVLEPAAVLGGAGVGAGAATQDNTNNGGVQVPDPAADVDGGSTTGSVPGTASISETEASDAFSVLDAASGVEIFDVRPSKRRNVFKRAADRVRGAFRRLKRG